MWVHGPARLVLELEAPGSTAAYVWVDGAKPERFEVDGRTTLVIDLEEAGWHVLLFRLPQLFDTNPPRGLRIVRLTLQPAAS
jgi:hypothetical protein